MHEVVKLGIYPVHHTVLFAGLFGVCLYFLFFAPYIIPRRSILAHASANYNTSLKFNKKTVALRHKVKSQAISLTF
jgi:hypothetical protein